MNIRITYIQVPAQVRFDLGNLEEMKVSLQTHGLLHPILVRQLSESSYELVAGYRRLQAADSLGWTEIPVTVLNPKDTLNQFDISLDENIQRKEFSIMEYFELILHRKLLWEQIHGPILNGVNSRIPSASDNLLTRVKSFYEETGKLLRKHPNDVYRLLQFHELDPDIKEQVESGKLPYRKALAEQSARKPLKESKPKKKRKHSSPIPQPPQDILALQHDTQRVIWVMGELYQAMRVIENQPYDLTPLADDHIVEMISVASSLINWLSLLNANFQNTLMQKMGLQVQNT